MNSTLLHETSFHDAAFLTAKEKGTILNAWKRFLKSGFQWGCFSNSLYHHLSLRSGFIAHYNRRGFFEEYFKDPADTLRFLDILQKGLEERMGWFQPREEYGDLNRAILAVLTP